MVQDHVRVVDGALDSGVPESPNRPVPRTGHESVVTPSRHGEMTCELA